MPPEPRGRPLHQIDHVAHYASASGPLAEARVAGGPSAQRSRPGSVPTGTRILQQGNGVGARYITIATQEKQKCSSGVGTTLARFISGSLCE